MQNNTNKTKITFVFASIKYRSESVYCLTHAICAELSARRVLASGKPQCEWRSVQCVFAPPNVRALNIHIFISVYRFVKWSLHKGQLFACSKWPSSGCWLPVNQRQRADLACYIIFSGRFEFSALLFSFLTYIPEAEIFRR